MGWPVTDPNMTVGRGICVVQLHDRNALKMLEMGSSEGRLSIVGRPAYEAGAAATSMWMLVTSVSH